VNNYENFTLTCNYSESSDIDLIRFLKDNKFFAYYFRNNSKRRKIDIFIKNFYLYFFYYYFTANSGELRSYGFQYSVTGIYDNHTWFTGFTNNSATITLNNATEQTVGDYRCDVINNYPNNTISMDENEHILAENEVSAAKHIQYYNQSFITNFTIESVFHIEAVFVVKCYYKRLPIDSFVSLSLYKDDQLFYIHDTKVIKCLLENVICFA
jgi:hypothetical protein